MEGKKKKKRIQKDWLESPGNSGSNDGMCSSLGLDLEELAHLTIDTYCGFPSAHASAAGLV